FPVTGGAIYKLYRDNQFITMPSFLKDEGYATFGFHGFDPEFYDRNLAYPKQGIDSFYHRKNLEKTENVGWGMTDHSVYEQMIPILKKAQPFYSMVVTLSSHHPFKIPATEKELQLDDDVKDTLVGDYLQSIRYTDKAIGELFVHLKDNDLLENTVVVMYGDHRGITMDDKKTMTKVLGKNYDEKTMYNIPLIIRLPHGEGAGVYPIAGGHIDTFPTLANLLGIPLPISALGRDLLNAKEGFVGFRAYLPEGSFINDTYFYKASWENKFEKGECFSLDDEKKVAVNNCQSGFDTANKLFHITDLLLKNDLVDDLEKK
ncbi:MAG: LTA synthase family protein, partial [Bacilli bacterium]